MSVAAQREAGLFIGGETVEGSESASSSSRPPASRSRRVQLAGEADVDRAVDAARAAQDGDWGKTPATERSRLLHALADAIVANRAELTELESRNVGKAISSVKAELFGAAENFRFYASASRRSRAARTRSAARSSSTRRRSRSASPPRSSPGTTRC